MDTQGPERAYAASCGRHATCCMHRVRAFRRLAATCIAALLLLLATRGNATIDGNAKDRDLAEAVSRGRAAAVARVLPSVVSITAYSKDGEEFGSGIVVGSNGEVLTARHVIRGANAIAVRFEDGAEFPAVTVGEDAYADLALIRMGIAGRKLDPATLGNENEMRVGETLRVVGSPFGLGGSVSRGILSAHRRRRVIPDVGVNLLQTDAAINPGCSGGPAVNLRGEVIGLVSAILTRNGGNQGVGFAVPASELKRALPYLRQGKPVPRARLGFTIKVHNHSVGTAESGLRVLKLAKDGPAQKAGVQPGDLVLRLNGRRVERIEELRSVLGSLEAGDPVRIGVRRGEKLLDLWATTGTLTKP